MNKREPRVPLTQEQRDRLLAREGYVILIHEPGANQYHGYVENSFSMSLDSSRTCLFGSGEYVSNFGTRHVLDGRADAEHHAGDLRKSHPDATVVVWEVHDENLPVILDWEEWLDAQAYDPNTLSGVTNKFKARNLRFDMREDL